MKRLATVSASLILVSVIWIQSFAQVVNIVRDARSDRTRDISGSSWQVYSGLRVVGKGSTVYLIADTTGSGTTTGSFAWTFLSRPTGSATTFTNPTGMSTKFMPEFLKGLLKPDEPVKGSKEAFDGLLIAHADSVGQ